MSAYNSVHTHAYSRHDIVTHESANKILNSLFVGVEPVGCRQQILSKQSWPTTTLLQIACFLILLHIPLYVSQYHMVLFENVFPCFVLLIVAFVQFYCVRAGGFDD
ncbi:unnamed protein product [Ceratitis capitata]|uniref:(Mediterranean fruit fly) hypothetical protein n=1 Tax=Ceratitis capitata TaxID=7213 RepID=A0A811V5M6_CERCA|nr:unnamed protein product [Ceratitis capitata]